MAQGLISQVPHTSPAREFASLPGDDETSRPRPWRRAAVSAFGVWLASNVAYVLASMYVWRLAKPPAPHMGDVGSTWHRQDATFYTGIAEQGYHLNPMAPAFYPLYPLLIRATNVLTPGGVLIAGMLVASACAYVALLLTHRLVDLELGESVAARATFFFAAWPMAFFLFAAYNESLFITLSVGALYAARRGNWWAASTLAMLAGATRLFGLLLLAPLCYEYLRQRQWSLRQIRWDALSFVLVPLGLAAYALYCQIEFGDWLAFSKAQAYWNRSYGWPGQAIVGALRLINTAPWLDEWHLLNLFEVGSVVAVIVLLVLGFVGPWRLRRDQYYLLVATIAPLILLSATTVGGYRYLTSAPRFALEFLAVFVILARMAANRAFERVYLAAAFTLQAIMLGTFLLNTAFVA